MNSRGALPLEEPGEPASGRAPRRLLLAAGAAWLVTRGLVLWLFLDRHSWVTGDVDYFANSLDALSDVGLGHTLVEYPLPGVVVVAVPWLVVKALGAPEAYSEAVLVLSMAADAAFLVLLACFAGRRRRGALTVWVLAVPMLGATAYARFDLVPGLLAGAALLLLVPHPQLAAAAGSLATGFKLWPGLVLPALAAPLATRRRVVTVIAATALVLAGVSVAVAGWGRLLSPLTWQAERGLQIESVAATPAMVGWALWPETFTVAFTEHNAFEVTGPGTQALLAASEVCSLLALPALLWLWVLAFRRGRTLTVETVAWLALTAVAAFMVTSKVLSPQYLLWLLPLAAAAVATSESRRLRSWTAILLLATALTQLVFPELYGEITLSGDHAGLAVAALAARNVLLVWLLARAAVLAVRGACGVSAAVRSSASHPAQRGTTTAPSGDGPTTRS